MDEPVPGPPRDLGHLLQAQARSHPDSIALLAPGRVPGTYADLARQASRLKPHLARLGLGRADRVALVLPDGPEMAGAFLTLTPSVAVAPLNPAYRAEDLDFYLEDLKARAVVVPQGSSGPASVAARARGLLVLELEVPPAAPSGTFDLRVAGPVAPPAVEPGPESDPEAMRPEHVALLLHTSGTTSRPKLVPLTHGNLCASGRHIAATTRLTPEDRCLCVMPLFHIHGLVGTLLSSVTAGASVACPPGFAAARFFEWLREFRPTWYSAVPTMHQAILERLEAPGAGEGELPRVPLRFIRSSSAALPPPVMERLEAAFGVPVIESYGMTEAAHQMASNRLPPGVRKPGSVGPAAGPEIAILDEQGRPVSQGERGEVCIRGSNVTPGYEGNPAANAAAFTTDGWFRTGDQGFLDAEGYLFLAGRLKEIVNRGGEKIGPREIDEALLQHPGVRQAVAFAVPHPTLGEDLAAVVVVIPGDHAPTEAELRAFLRERLPAFKVPTRILPVDQIPKGPTGKVQRIGLHQRLAAHFETPYEEPRPGLESDLAAAFREVLGVPRVGRHDHFFSLGGDSLRATRVAARVNDLLGLDVSLVLVFQHPTLAELAAELTRRTRPPAPADDVDALADLLAGLPAAERERLLAEASGNDGGEHRRADFGQP